MLWCLFRYMPNAHWTEFLDFVTFRLHQPCGKFNIVYYSSLSVYDISYWGLQYLLMYIISSYYCFYIGHDDESSEDDNRDGGAAGTVVAPAAENPLNAPVPRRLPQKKWYTRATTTPPPCRVSTAARLNKKGNLMTTLVEGELMITIIVVIPSKLRKTQQPCWSYLRRLCALRARWTTYWES